MSILCFPNLTAAFDRNSPAMRTVIIKKGGASVPRKPKVQQAGDGQMIRCKVRVSPDEEQTKMQAELQGLARKIVSGLSALEPAQGKALLDSFVSELFVSVAKQEQHKTRSQRQAEGIAEAKARGVRFGPKPRAMPDGFEELRQAWRNKEMLLSMAAELCGVPRSTFHDAAIRAEMAASHTEEG